MLFVPSLNDAFCALCLRDGVYGLLIQGSWGSTQFGYKGWYVLPEGYFKNSPFTDGWGVYSTVIDAPK
jgi:hypothetical protein